MGSELAPRVLASLARGIGFLDESATRHDAAFRSFGRDYVLCLDGIARRLPARHADLRGLANTTARRLASRLTASLDAGPGGSGGAEELRDALFSLFALSRVGVPGPTLEGTLQLTGEGLLPFDLAEPPPADAYPLPRGHPLAPLVNTRHAAWTLSLATAHACDTLGSPSRACASVRLPDALRWLPSLRPYSRAEESGGYAKYHDQAYALVALAHALSDYGRRPCARAPTDLGENLGDLGGELSALNETVGVAIDDGDVGMAAAAADALALCGAVANATDAVRSSAYDPAIRNAIRHVLASQRADGGWGPAEGTGPGGLGDTQDAYAPTCSAALALASSAALWS